MAVNETREMRRSLLQGATDGTYKSRNPNWDGPLSPDTGSSRTGLDMGRYDVTELPLEARHQPGGDYSR